MTTTFNFRPTRTIDDTLPALGGLVPVSTDTSLIFKGRITSGDLNDFREPGIYVIRSGGDASGIANTPASNSGAVLEIISPDTIRSRGSNNLVIQRYTQRTRSGGITETWVRPFFIDDSWGEWQKTYTDHNILGTVSQSSGVPTGAIIERGSNANGDYVRYADGTQLCWSRAGLVDHTDSLSSATRLVGAWAYPVAFLNADPDGRPSVQMDIPMHTAANFTGCSRLDIQAWGMTNDPGPSTTNFSIFFTGGVSTTDASVINIKLFAIGRWF